MSVCSCKPFLWKHNSTTSKPVIQLRICCSMSVSAADRLCFPAGRFRLASLVQYVPLPVVAVGP